jgi:hypothetical protein
MTNNLTVYRDRHLSEAEYASLENAADKFFSFRERVIDRVVWSEDEYGDRVQRRDQELAGIEVFAKGPVNKGLLESMCRPARPAHAVMHLTRLSIHLPYGRGADQFGLLVEDIARDLTGVSEYAIIKTCERFRLDPDLTFFPASALIVKYARDLDWSLKNIEKPAEPAPAPKAAPAPANVKRTSQQKRRVARLLRLMGKPQGKWSRWERRFFDGFNKHAKGT